MINIPVQSLVDMPCYDQQLVCYAMVHDRRFEMLFAGSWGFEYRVEASDTKIGERIKSRAALNMNYLQRYHGIMVIKKEFTEQDNVLCILEEEIGQENPVMVFISSYYFPWNEQYKKFENNLPHAMWVVGIDWDKKCVYCVDNMFQKQDIMLSFEDLLAGNNGKYWLIRCLPEYEKEIDIDEVIHYSLEKLKRNTNEIKDIQDIRRLAAAMRQSFDLKYEIDNTHGGIWVEPIIFNIGGVVSDRTNYTRLLNYLLEQKEDVNIRRVKENMEKISLEWNQIRGLLIKGYYLEDPEKLNKRIIDRIEKTADLEEETFRLLEHWTEKSEIISQINADSEREEVKLEEVHFLQLKEFFNNQSFGIYNDRLSVANIGGMRYFFYLNETVSQGSWELGDMKFYHEPISGREMDSIKCTGQMIKVPPEEYDCIMLMGYGDLSTFKEELEIQYMDDTCEAIKIEIPHSSIPNQFIKNSMIWNGRCGFIDEIEEHAWYVGIYAKLYPVQRKAIKCVKLPVCPNIILMAISVGKYKCNF